MPEMKAMETPSGRLSTDEIISAVAQLSLPEIEEVFDQVLALQAKRKAAHFASGLPKNHRHGLRCYTVLTSRIATGSRSLVLGAQRHYGTRSGAIGRYI